MSMGFVFTHRRDKYYGVLLMQANGNGGRDVEHARDNARVIMTIYIAIIR